MDSKDGSATVLSTFEPVDVNTWMAKIIKDLRGKSPDDVTWHYDKDISISPFAGADAETTKGSEVGFDPGWEIAEEFIVSDPVAANDQIITALQGGCEVLLVKVEDILDWSVLFREVQFDMIKTYVIPPSEQQESVIASLNQWIFDTGLPHGSVLVRSDKVATMGAAHEAREQSVVDLLANTIHAGIEWIELSAPDSEIECIAEIGPHFFIEVARLRALRILWTNVLNALSKEGPQLLIETRCADKFMSDDRYANMVSAGSKAISAICGGADRIVINTVDRDSIHSRRIARNVHHILRYESGLDAIPDPVKGSYYLEKLTAQLVTKTWEKVVAD